MYPCPSCGFKVFDGPAGSHELCPVCGWEDDPVQLMYPKLRGGSNRGSLREYQASILRELPFHVRQCHHYRRDPAWRPLTDADYGLPEDQPQSNMDYILSTLRPARYYWQA